MKIKQRKKKQIKQPSNDEIAIWLSNNWEIK